MNRAWGWLGEGTQLAIDADRWFRAVDAPPHWDPEPFEVLARSLRNEASLTPFGRIVVVERVVGALRARRHVEAVAAPAGPLSPPIIIVGLQRTGTTLLQRLLSSVPGHRGLMAWEALSPGPVPGERSPQGRIRRAERAATALRYIAPDFVAVHPVEARSPEEEVVLFEQIGLSTGFEATLRVPSYAAWLEEQDQRPTYVWLERVLRLLDADAQWVLKTPHHLEFLDDLAAQFPDARLVWTHRDPRVTVPSFCSMVAHGQGLCTDRVLPLEIGQHWLRKTSRMVRRAHAFRKAHPEWPILDVAYEALTADPIGTVSQIMAFAGRPFGEAERQAVEAKYAENARHKYGRHVYDASDFGLDDDAISAAFPEGA